MKGGKFLLIWLLNVLKQLSLHCIIICLQCFDIVSWASGRPYRSVKIEWSVAGMVIYCSEMICIWSIWCHCHLLVSCFLKYPGCFTLLFWPTQVFVLKRPLNSWWCSYCVVKDSVIDVWLCCWFNSLLVVKSRYSWSTVTCSLPAGCLWNSSRPSWAVSLPVGCYHPPPPSAFYYSAHIGLILNLLSHENWMAMLLSWALQ